MEHHGHDHDHDKEGDQVITTNMLVKWGAILVAICTTLVSLVWFCASIKQDQALEHEEVATLKKQTEERRLFVDHRFDEISIRQTRTDTNVEELNRKMDVVTAILQRIDLKLGKP